MGELIGVAVLGVLGIVLLGVLILAVAALGFDVDVPHGGPAVFALIGVAGVIAGAGLLVEAAAFRAGAETAAGEVVRISVSRTAGSKGHSTTAYTPVVRFRPAAGGPVAECQGISSNVNPLRVGDRVPVVYPTGRPGDARLATFGQFWAPGLIFAAAGAGCLALAAAWVRSARQATAVLGAFATPDRVTVVTISRLGGRSGRP